MIERQRSLAEEEMSQQRRNIINILANSSLSECQQAELLQSMAYEKSMAALGGNGTVTMGSQK